jgi:hypothetical protein
MNTSNRDWASGSGHMLASGSTSSDRGTGTWERAPETEVASLVAASSRGGASTSWSLLPEGASIWRRMIWASVRIILPSFLSCPGRSRLSCTIPHKPHEFHQGLRSQKDREQVLRCFRGRHRRDGKVCPLPGEGKQLTVLTAQDHPGLFLAPEDVADASRLPAGGTLLGQDRGPCSLKCNIRCGLFWG